MTTTEEKPIQLPPGPLVEAYKRLVTVEAAVNVDAKSAPPEVTMAANEAFADFAEHAKADVSLLFMTLLETIDQKDRYKFALMEMIQAYSGYVPEDDPLVRQNPNVPAQDLIEVRMFRAFLKAASILGIKPVGANRRIERAVVLDSMIQRGG